MSDIERIEISDSKMCDLPLKVLEMLRIYGRPVQARNSNHRAYEMPNYRREEIEEVIALSKIEGGQS